MYQYKTIISHHASFCSILFAYMEEQEVLQGWLSRAMYQCKNTRSSLTLTKEAVYFAPVPDIQPPSQLRGPMLQIVHHILCWSPWSCHAQRSHMPRRCIAMQTLATQSYRMAPYSRAAQVLHAEHITFAHQHHLDSRNSPQFGFSCSRAQSYVPTPHQLLAV